MQKKLLADPIYSGVPLTPDNFLQIDVFTNQQNWDLLIEGLAYNIDGTIVPFRESHLITNVLTVNTFTIRLGYFALISVVCHTTTGTVPDGSTFCRITLIGPQTGGAYPFRKHLAQGYLSYYQSVGYGSTGMNDSGADHKYAFTLIGGDPSSGDPYQYTLPPWYHMEIHHVYIKFATDATVINRYLFLNYDSGGGTTNRVVSLSPLPQSRTTYVHFYSHCVETYLSAIDTLIVPMPVIRLDYGGVFSVSAYNIQATDQLSEPQIVFLNQIKPY